MAQKVDTYERDNSNNGRSSGLMGSLLLFVLLLFLVGAVLNNGDGQATAVA